MSDIDKNTTGQGFAGKAGMSKGSRKTPKELTPTYLKTTVKTGEDHGETHVIFSIHEEDPAFKYEFWYGIPLRHVKILATELSKYLEKP